MALPGGKQLQMGRSYLHKIQLINGLQCVCPGCTKETATTFCFTSFQKGRMAYLVSSVS